MQFPVQSRRHPSGCRQLIAITLTCFTLFSTTSATITSSSPFVGNCTEDAPDIESKVHGAQLTLKVIILHIIPTNDPKFYQATANVTSILNGKFNGTASQSTILIEPFTKQPTANSHSCVGSVQKDGTYIVFVNATLSLAHYISLYPPEEWNEMKEEHIWDICQDCDPPVHAPNVPPLVACNHKMGNYCFNGGTCYHLAHDENELFCRCAQDYIGTRCEVFSFVDFARAHDKKVQDEIRVIALQFFLYGAALILLTVIILAALFSIYWCVFRQKKKVVSTPSKYVQADLQGASLTPNHTLRTHVMSDDEISILSRSSIAPRAGQVDPRQINGDIVWPMVELLKSPSSRQGSIGSMPSNIMRTTPFHNAENGYGQQIQGAGTPANRKQYSTLPVRDY